MAKLTFNFTETEILKIALESVFKEIVLPLATLENPIPSYERDKRFWCPIHGISDYKQDCPMNCPYQNAVRLHNILTSRTEETGNG
jgi:hypothetical protein